MIEERYSFLVKVRVNLSLVNEKSARVIFMEEFGIDDVEDMGYMDYDEIPLHKIVERLLEHLGLFVESINEEQGILEASRGYYNNKPEDVKYYPGYYLLTLTEWLWPLRKNAITVTLHCYISFYDGEKPVDESHPVYQRGFLPQEVQK